MINRKPAAFDGIARVVADAAPKSAPSSLGNPNQILSAWGDEAVGLYLADMIGQLESLARASNKNMLAYLLSMAGAQAVAPDARWESSKSLH
jgi:hypothetical protein